MVTRALRRRLAHLPLGIVEEACRRGVVHAGAREQLYGVDIVATVALPPDQTSPFDLPKVHGDDGPASSDPHWHGVLPFDPSSDGTAHLAATQLCATEGDVFATVLGDDLAELEQRLDRLTGEIALDVEPHRKTPELLSLVEEPSRQRYVELVEAAVRAMHSSSTLDKVVLARRVLVELAAPLDPAAALEHMAEREPSCTRYSVPFDDGRLIGASPELLISRRGEMISSHPLAGTISLEDDAIDAALLSKSTKDVEEHRLVVDDIAERLLGLVDELDVPTTPSIVGLRDVAHLGTSITARSGHGGPSALALLRAIHPTPAIGGVPRGESLSIIRELEARDRGLFGGAVGWSSANGDGEWVLAIRGALLVGSRIDVCAGAGIVPASDPSSEGEETRVKLASILEALVPGSSALLSRE